VSEQQQHTSDEQVPWWVQSCRWLKAKLPYVWGTLIVGTLVSTLANLNTTSTDTPLSKLYLAHVVLTYPLTVFAALGVLLLLTLLALIGSHERDTSSPSLSEQNRTHMLGRLCLRYEQMMAQSLQGAVQIELGLVSRPTAVQNAASLSLRLPNQADQPLSPHTTIKDAYNLAHQELLILGEPGAGKSTLLLELALYLVKQAEQDTALLLPILLPLSSWASSRRSLQDWLIEQCVLLYNVPRRLSQQWIQMGVILPLLDGLDEMDATARSACIAAINTYHQAHLQPLVVCSRINEYKASSRRGRLTLHAAIVVQPLSPEQVDTYLMSLGKPVAALRTTLCKHAALRRLATTPLMLQVLIGAYQGTNIRELPKKRVALQQRVWNDYIESLVERKGKQERFSLKQIYRCLGWLAQQMRLHNQTILFLEQLQPDWLSTRQRIFYRGSVMLIIILLAVLGEILAWLLTLGIPVILIKGGASIADLLPSILAGIPLGLTVALPVGVYIGLRAIRPSEVLNWSWSDMWPSMLVGLFVGIPGGLALPALRKHLERLTGRQLANPLSLGPNEGIQRSAKNGLLAGLPLGFLVGVFYALYVSVLLHLFFMPYKQTSAEFLFVLLEGLYYGLFASLVIAFLFGLGAFIQHYLLRFWLWRTNTFPWNAVAFLEDATARVLLQRVDRGYSFTHHLLLDYFADLNTTSLSTSASVPPPSSPTP
jgi:hypothetical protein